MLSFKQYLAKNYINALGWNTNRHMVIIESDDWGSVRMPDIMTYKNLILSGYKVDKQYFDRNDSLESVEDLTSLYEVLTTVKDKNGHYAVITPLSVCANPDFEKIENADFQQYFYEPLTETYKRNKHTIGSYELLKQGIENYLYRPQFHGREHIQVQRWMDALKSGDISTKESFKYRAIISSRNDNSVHSIENSFFPAFAYKSQEEIDNVISIIKDGLSLFEKIYGYKATSLCPPCGIVNQQILESTKDLGIIGLQSGQHYEPKSDGSLKRIDKYWGTQSSVGQIYWRRNCTFEPSRNQDFDWVDHCLSEIKIAFRWHKPAVINSHRVNYIGSIFPENRDRTLYKMISLLKAIVKYWPDVEFVDSDTLLKIMIENKK